MDKLWAPWRMEYIENVDNKGCIFCKAIAEDDDKANLVLYRGKTSFIILNRYPYNNGHLMVATNEHLPDFGQLTDEAIIEFIKLTDKAISVLQDSLNPAGYNLGVNLGRIAGAGVEGHLHLHLVPRWPGDTNFMPVIADTKVLAERLIDTYDRLKKNIK